jgi:nucleoside-diphosphate-sugar epimerase
MTNTTAVLVGSSGLIGKALQAKLADKYDKLWAISRKPMGNLPTNTANVVLDFEGDWLKTSLPNCNAFFCALGTTIKVAGSQEAFRKVDFDYVVNSAKAAKRAGATKMAVVSALGASSKSSVFYNRTKGEMEVALKSLGFSKLLIVRPSFLSGNREVLGQASRPGEAIALAFTSILNPLIPKKYRSISADAVACCMVEQLDSVTSSLEVIESDQLQQWQKT